MHFYQISTTPSTKIAASWHEIRNILCLHGGSRQDVAASSAKAAVFTGDCPAAPTFRRMNHPRGSRFQSNRPVGTGRRRPNALDAS